ncbi:hypothetical protein FQA39_LY06611 [Lamprigera yunnana]|nr:hypothetical protein FQA39_LY06611 [Lamprigera yunnana]
MLTAYDKSVQSTDDTPTESFEDWYNKKSNTVPQFKYWDMALKLELVVLQLIKSLCLADFSLYKDSLSCLIGWFFVFDQVHYTRWLAVHICDPQTHPDVNTNFEAGNFVAMKTKRVFSAIAFDQNHEQVNACLKGDGGGGMASNLVVLDHSLPISSKSGLIDWSLCFISQNDTGEKLTNPERSRYLFFLKRQFKKKLRKEMSFLSVLLLLQVTAAVLYNLMLTAYEKSVQSADDTPTEAFEDWYNKKSNTVPQFKYWDMVLKLELVVLQLIKLLCSADFSLYNNSLSRLIGWFFVFDQLHCARWLAVHIRDPQTHPDVNTNFVAMKTKRAFSSIASDQNHEQVNACLKRNGGKIQYSPRATET